MPAMQVLLKRGNNGQVLKGADQQLRERAQVGDDLCLFIESIGYDETIIFGNYVLHADSVSALSLPHLAHGDLSEAAILDREPITTAQYIYDSRTNNVLAKDFLDENRTLTTVYTNNPVYKSYTWYSARRYAQADFCDTEGLIACGDQFKVRLDLTDDFKIVLKPDIIYFPHQAKDYLVKSSAMLLPTEFIFDPRRYLAEGRPLSTCEGYSLCYLNIGSDNTLTIIGEPRFIADERVDAHVREGTVSRQAEGRTLVTRVECAHAILVPEKRANQPGRKGMNR
jgi:hypothetical protein